MNMARHESGMRWRGVFFALPFMAMTMAIVAPQERVEAKAAAGIAWQPSMQAALKESKRTGKPIMVDFFATWCGPCKMLDRDTFSNARVIRESRRWIAVKVDIDKEPKLAEKYNVSVIPTIAFLRPNGTLAARFVGYRKPSRALESMRWSRRYAKKRRPISA